MISTLKRLLARKSSGNKKNQKKESLPSGAIVVSPKQHQHPSVTIMPAPPKLIQNLNTFYLPLNIHKTLDRVLGLKPGSCRYHRQSNIVSFTTNNQQLYLDISDYLMGMNILCNGIVANKIFTIRILHSEFQKIRELPPNVLYPNKLLDKALGLKSGSFQCDRKRNAVIFITENTELLEVISDYLSDNKIAHDQTVHTLRIPASEFQRLQELPPCPMEKPAEIKLSAVDLKAPFSIPRVMRI